MNYIIKKEITIDSEGKPVERVRLIPCRASRTSPEIQERIQEEFEREIKRMSTFFGEFVCLLQNRCIHIPWDIDTVNDAFVWMLIKNEHHEKIIFTYANHEVGAEDCQILQQGKCNFTENGAWLFPEALLPHIGDERCVWIGRSRYAELMSEQDRQRALQEFDIDHLLNQFK